ncbi:hypothetical protein VNO80_08979 [Phaseolus coccineus]|uniref:Uncharacterized protein n=1 Tax=Phaseolus coccineus TaxID=3886 RepID=A0AAN9N5C5_PHACN
MASPLSKGAVVRELTLVSMSASIVFILMLIMIQLHLIHLFMFSLVFIFFIRVIVWAGGTPLLTEISSLE